MALLSTLLAIATFTYHAHAHEHNHMGCGADRVQNRKIIQNMNSFPKGHPKSKSILEGRSGDPTGLDATFEAIRIQYDTSQIESDWVGYSRRDFFVNDVFPAAEAWLEKVIKVRPVDGDLTLARDCNTFYQKEPVLQCTASGVPSNPAACGDTGAIMPDSVLEAMEVCSDTNSNDCDATQYPAGSGGYSNTDLIIYVTGDADKDGTTDCQNVMGFASYCESNVWGRPIAGYINLCRESIDSQIENGVLTWEESLALIIHETFHVLGFSTDGFKNFINSAGENRQNTDGDVWNTETDIVRGERRVKITLPTVIEKAIEFYGCSSIDGLETENFGYTDQSQFTRPSSHWDNRVILNDFMISYVPLGPWYSAMTLAALADSGWYEINWEYAQEGTYGRNEGCDWFTKKCIVDGTAQFDEFCASQIDRTCGEAQIGKAYCPVITNQPNTIPTQEQYFSSPTKGGDTVYPDFCPIIKAYSNGDCRLWSDNDADASDFGELGTEDLGGLISGTSKCMSLSGSPNNDDSNACFPTHCFKDAYGSYVGTRISIYRSFSRVAVDAFTCWSDESGDKYDFDYSPATRKDFGFTKIACPDFDDMCYEENPWICNGHGTMVGGSCVCSPGYMGIDCTIEANEDNRNTYDDTSSLNVFTEQMCGGGFDYTGTEDNVGIIEFTITDVDSSTYNEAYFTDALKSFVSIVTMIPQCETDVPEINYNSTESSVLAEVWYFSSHLTWGEVSSNNKVTVFENLFGSTPSYIPNVVKDAAGDQLDNESANPDSVARFGCNIFIFTVFYCVLAIIF